MEPGVLELATHVFEGAAQILPVAHGVEEALDVVHPEADRFHVKRRDGAAKCVGLALQPVALAAGRQRGNPGQQPVESGECGRGSRGHVGGNSL